MVRTSITIARKLMILRDASERMANGESLKAVARSHGVQPCQIRYWRKRKAKLDVTTSTKRTTGKGRPSSIKHLEDQVIGWALEMRQFGVGLSYRHLQLKACRADAEFAQKSKTQQYQMIRRLCAANCLVPRRKTHVAQENPQVAIDCAKEWLMAIRPLFNVPQVDKKYIVNMDQTPLPFSLASDSTLSLVGESTVTVRATGNEKTRCTVSLSVCADGTKLKPMIIFKGERQGRIATKEFPTSQYRNDLVLAAHPSAWQDEENLQDWVDGVLVPHLQQNANGAPVFLFLDHFAAHLTENFRNRMTALGVQLNHIPKGCTWLVQPIDVGIGKPFKERMRDRWWDWMIEPTQADGAVPKPSREDIQQWVHETWEAMPEEIIRNSWLKTDLSWFLDV